MRNNYVLFGTGALAIACFVEVGWIRVSEMKDWSSNLLVCDARFRAFGPPVVHEFIGCDF